MINYSNAGLISTYTDGTNRYPIFNPETSTQTGLFIEIADAINGLFYCTRGQEVRSSLYRSPNGSWCTFHDDAQLALQQQINVVNNSITEQVTTVVQGKNYDDQIASLNANQALASSKLSSIQNTLSQINFQFYKFNKYKYA